MEKDTQDKLKKTVIAATAVATAIAGSEINEQELFEKQSKEPEPVVEYTDMPGLKARINIGEVQTENKGKLWHSIISIPLWIAGHFASLLAAPIVGTVMSWVLVFFIVLGIVIAALKWVFPDRKIRELVNKKTVGGSFIAIVLFAVLDTVLMIVSVSYARFKSAVRFALVLALIIAIIVIRYRKICAPRKVELVMPDI